MDESLEAFKQYLRQNVPKRAAMVKLLLRSYRLRLERLSDKQLSGMVVEQSMAQIDEAKVWDPQYEPLTRDQIIERFIENRRLSLEFHSLEQLAEMFRGDEVAS